MMKNEIKVCDDCFDRICKKNAGCGRLWIDLCNAIQLYPVIISSIPEFEELRILELMGYIVTTERKEHILIRVLGDASSFFCNGECDG